MIFAAATDERTLCAFSNEEEAVAACEAIDVEDGTWVFWSEDGTPLQPIFTVPNKRGLFTVGNGVYHLEPTDALHLADLEDAVDEILNFECPAPLNSASGIKAHLNSARYGRDSTQS